MKKLFCALAALILLLGFSLAETSIIEQPQIIIEMITPSPSPEPVGETFSSEDIIVTLPAGMGVLTDEERAGYDAAVGFDFPAAGEAVLLAVNPQTGAVLVFTILESAQDAEAAATEAALDIPGAGAVEEIKLGDNNYCVFSFACDEQTLYLFFLSDGERLLCVGACGLEDDDINTMLTGLDF